MPKLIFIFLDGVGVGRPSPNNPFYKAKADYLPFYSPLPTLPDNTPVKAIDACLGVPGLPMSATGQTTLYTGINAAKFFNQHKDSYPDQEMRRMIKHYNLFTRLKLQHLNPRFLNAYPGVSELFVHDHAKILNDGSLKLSSVFRSQTRIQLSVTSCMILASYMKPFGKKDLAEGNALYHEFSNKQLIGSGLDLPEFSPEKAAEIIFNVSRKYDLLLYEFFLTDMYGHGSDIEDCVWLIKQLNRLMGNLISLLNKEKDTLLLTSDHGNLEDSLTPLHTAAPVPLICWGANADQLRSNIDSLVDVTPAIEDFFN